MKVFTVKNEEIQRLFEDSDNPNVFRTRIIECFREAESYDDKLLANKLEVMSDMYLNEKVIEFKKLLERLDIFMHNISCMIGIKIQVEARLKAWISLVRKIQLHIVTGQPLDEIYDGAGIRIVVGSSEIDNIFLLNFCDTLMNEVLKFFITQGFVLKDLKQTYKKGFEREEHPEIIVQEKSLIDPEYRNNVKNYNKNVKPNGYQSLHAVIQSKESLYEIQIRTMSMHKRSEAGSAEHTAYKCERYHVIEEKGGQIFAINLAGAKMKEIEFNGDEIKDKSGLTEPIFLTERVQTC